tara:strand:- start:8964 stop:10424 length:1461 start_codon:yes stop_codon:yes gene_type:complete
MATYTTTNTANDTVSEVMSNNNSIEVVGLNGTIVKCEKVENEFGNKIKFSISGKSVKGKSKVVGRLTVDVASNKKFTKAPGLRKSIKKRNNNVSNLLTTKLRSIEKDADGNVIKYIYDLIYRATKNSKISTGSDYTMTNLSSKDLVSIRTIIKGVDSIDCGSELIKSFEQTKTLKIKGHPEASVIIVTTTLIDSVDADGKDIGYVEKVTTPSVYSKKLTPNSETYGVENIQVNTPIGEAKAIRATLSTNGQYILKQKYPAVNSTTRHGIHVFPNLVTSRFNANRYSKLDYWKDFTVSDGYSGAYSKIITQYINPKLTLSATISNVGSGGVRTVTLNGVSMTGSNNITRYYTGNYNNGHISSTKERPLVVNETTGPQLNGGSNLELISVTYTVLASHAITVDRRPKFSPGSTFPEESATISSDWSNSESAENGGCVLNLVSYNTPVLSANGGVANGKATIDLIFRVQNYGTKDVTMHIDLANLITIT